MPQLRPPKVINYFNKLIKYIVLYVFLSLNLCAIAGSYEDFFQATQKNDVQVVSNLLSRGFDPNTVNLEGESALFLAWKFDSLKVLEILIKHPKTNLNIQNSHAETILMLVCLKGNLNLTQQLIDRKADINQPGWTPLHYAATGGHAQIAKLLLDESAYIDAESPNGSTPLMMAARYGRTELVRLLIDEGADIRIKNQLGLSALDFAKEGARPDAMRLIESALVKNKP